MLKSPSLAALCVIAMISVASADEVILNDGSRIVGEVQRLDNGKLKIKTGFAGDLEIDAKNVKAIGTEQDVNVRLDSGDTVIGKLNVGADGTQTVTGDAVGQRQLPAGGVKAVWSKDDVSPEVAQAQAKYEAARAKWSLHLEFGLNGETGNQERIGVIGRAEAKRTTDTDRLSIYAQGRYNRENGVDTTREILGGVNLEVDLNDRLFVWGKTELENDKFEDLELRTTATGGLGYFLLRKPDQEWKVRGGAGLQFESFENGEDTVEAIGEAGHNYWVEIAPWLKYTHSISVFVPFDDPGGWRGVMENAGEIPITKDENWKLRIGVRNQYDADPQPGVKSLDTFYFANIAFDWE